MSRTPRQQIVDALTGVEYIDATTVGARCPICDQPMAVRFPGQLVAFECCFTGCTEAAIAKALFNHDEDAFVAAHRARLVDLLAGAAFREPTEELREAA